MPYHRVKQGECLSSIAAAAGFADSRSIYDHAENSEFRKLRDNPNLTYPGDRLFLPDPESESQDCGTETRHRFRRMTEPVFLRLVFLDREGQPLSGLAYELEVEGQEFSGETTSEGAIECQIPADKESGWLTLWLSEDEPVSWSVAIGHLDPLSYDEGVQARLNNLGYDCGEVDGDFGDRSQSALAEFQRDAGLEPGGTPNEETLEKLADAHD